MFAKFTEVTFSGKTYRLAYTAKAMFEISDFAKDKEIMEILMDHTKEGFSLFCQTAEAMSQAAEELRRYESGQEGAVLTAKEIQMMARPVDLLNLKGAMTKAIAYGFGREIQEENDEVDVGLAELQKKTK
ncbi:hypothetical protein [Hominifimenecus sp. rT4P-3]|uniref:hypothetical protein n=1 Tax=Hominifimenecus sp. rT4P-3 TaxID=3242979 RepID=UPI003DA1E41E